MIQYPTVFNNTADFPRKSRLYYSLVTTHENELLSNFQELRDVGCQGPSDGNCKMVSPLAPGMSLLLKITLNH